MTPAHLVLLSIASASLGSWIYLWLGRAHFWRIEREEVPAAPSAWPDVVVVIPARNEAEVIGATLASLWSQDYPRPIRLVVVDDGSEDGTTNEALRAAGEHGRRAELRVVRADPPPPGWAGKVWAMNEGVVRGMDPEEPATYILFSDADIVHDRGAVRDLVARAEGSRLDLASYMVRLSCKTPAERLMIPAFVFYFRMLFPFGLVNNPASRLAAAAGGTMLVRRCALERIGGMAAIQGALIDDCALARAIKAGGNRIWLGLSSTSHSTRTYHGIREIVAMVARSAYTQLGYSPAALAGCVAGLALTYLAPPLLLLRGVAPPAILSTAAPAALGLAAWLVMSLLYMPMLRSYRQPFWLAPLLPATAAIYLWATLLSAWQYYMKVGSTWRGRSTADIRKS